MGTMRNNFAAAFVLFILMLSTSQSMPWSTENSSKRNSLADTVPGKSRSVSSSTVAHKCIFVDTKLPMCDEKWMLNYRDEEEELKLNEQEAKGSQENVQGHVPRLRRSTEDTAKGRIVIYTIVGCLPRRLPFPMTPCDPSLAKNLPNSQIEVKKLRPFTVRGLRRPPYVFPKFDFNRWQRMMNRFHKHVASKTHNKKHGVADWKISPTKEVPQGLTAELMNAATTKETMPNAMAASINTANGSSPNKLIIPGQTKVAESFSKEKEADDDAVPAEAKRIECNESSGSSSIENRKGDRRNKAEAQSTKSHGRARAKVFNKDTVSLRKSSSNRSVDGDVIADAIPAIPVSPSHVNRDFYELPILRVPSNDLADPGDSNGSH